MNPYNSSKPGYQFVGYERMLRQIHEGFRNGNSFAILGGRRCGKTSLLIQIEQNLINDGLEDFHALPRYLDIQSLGTLTSDALFEKIYSATVQDIKAPTWVSSEPGREYEQFITQLKRAQSDLENHHGANWLVILLIDELDNAVSKLPDDQFFQNLRNLLMVSKFHRHFRMVASGVKEMAHLISSGSSPLNNLRHKYLAVLTGKQADRLVQIGFLQELDTETKMFLYRLTGKHPYLLQGVLEHLWDEQGDRDSKAVKHAAKAFSQETETFKRWSDSFGAAERSVYEVLMNADAETMHIKDIRNQVESKLSHEVEDALTVLSFHGVIDDSDDPDEPKITGSMFKDWFEIHCPEQATLVKMPEPTGPKTHENQTPNIQVNVKVNNDNKLDANQGLKIDEIMRLFKALKIETINSPLDEKIQVEVESVLNEGIKEVKKSAPDKKVLESSLDKAAGILKKAGATADQMHTFLEKAKKLGLLLGKAVGWTCL